MKIASDNLVKTIIATAQLMGNELSDDAARMFCEDLVEFDEQKVISSLQRCRQEIKGRLTIADIIARIDDGHPGPQEAWAMMPKNEDDTVVWTDEMATAWGIASSLLSSDEIAARMTFIEVYNKEILKARQEHRQIKWRASLGHSIHGREGPLREALEKGRLPYQKVQQLLPDIEIETPKITHDSGTKHISKFLKEITT